MSQWHFTNKTWGKENVKRQILGQSIKKKLWNLQCISFRIRNFLHRKLFDNLKYKIDKESIKSSVQREPFPESLGNIYSCCFSTLSVWWSDSDGIHLKWVGASSQKIHTTKARRQQNISGAGWSIFGSFRRSADTMHSGGLPSDPRAPTASEHLKALKVWGGSVSGHRFAESPLDK